MTLNHSFSTTKIKKIGPVTPESAVPYGTHEARLFRVSFLFQHKWMSRDIHTHGQERPELPPPEYESRSSWEISDLESTWIFPNVCWDQNAQWGSQSPCSRINVQFFSTLESSDEVISIFLHSSSDEDICLSSNPFSWNESSLRY